MKALLTGILLISSMNAFAGINDLTVKEVFRRGYTIHAQVDLDEGLVIVGQESIVGVSKRCSLEMRSTTNDLRILKKGRVIKLDSTTKEGQYEVVRSSTDKTIDSLYFSNRFESILIKDLKESCEGLKFKIVPGTNLQEA